jgi:beta-N-acetylhexosaminidase
MSKFYPFIDEVLTTESPQSTSKQEVVGAIMCPVIDPSYSNLTEIFKFGLICSGITFLKSIFHENENVEISQCIMLGVGDDNKSNLGGIQEIGFQEWKVFTDSFDTRTVERRSMTQ